MSSHEHGPNNGFGHTAENDHFFIQGKREDSEVVYQGSALIVSLLEMHMASERIDPEAIESTATQTSPPARELAFFDKRGNFYSPVLLHGLYRDVNVNGASLVKHTAVFEPVDQPDAAFAIPIDDIHCLSLAKPVGVQAEQFINSPKPI